MKPLRLTPQQVREIDRIAIEEYAIPSLALMEAAAMRVVECILLTQVKAGLNRAAIILCGKGNNGGDGFAIARLLFERDWQVLVVLYESPEKLKGDGLINYQKVVDLNGPTIVKSSLLDEIKIERSFVIDAIYGTGFRPPSAIDLKIINVFAHRNQHFVVAVDVPSGMDANDGSVIDENAIRADKTVTFVCEKPGFAGLETKKWTGELVVADIGVPEEIVIRVMEGR